MTLENLIGKGLRREPASIHYLREKLRPLDEFRRQRATGLYDGSSRHSGPTRHPLW